MSANSASEFPREKGLKALIRSIVLSKALDLLQPGEYRILKNVRQYEIGEIRSRPPIVRLNPNPLADLNLHSVRLLNDPLLGVTVVLVGAGTNLYSGVGTLPSSFVSVDSGYDGTPLTMLPFRPNQNASPFLYIANGGKMRRIQSGVGGSITAQNWGIAPPTAPPTVTLQTSQLSTISTGLATTGWSPDGTILATVGSGTVASGVTINAIVYDSGSTGWASATPTGVGDLSFFEVVVPGTYLTINTGGGSQENVYVDSLYKPIKTTTIASITYDSGSTGLCTIVLSASHHRNLVKNAMVEVNTEFAVIQSVTTGPDGSLSIRLFLANTHSAGETVTGQSSFRAVYANSHSAGESISASDITVNANAASGVGTLNKSITIDLSTNGGRDTQDDDNIVVFLNIPHPQWITEIQVMFDVSTGGGFVSDYYFKALRPDDFLGSFMQTTTTLNQRQQKIQRQQVDQTPTAISQNDTTTKDYFRNQHNQLAIAGMLGRKGPDHIKHTANMINPVPGPSSNQTVSGSTASNTVRIAIKDFTRVGQDLSKGWKDVGAVQFRVTLSGATAAQEAFAIQGITLIGSYGPDTGTVNQPYQHCYRWLNNVTGARSNPSPPTRSGISSSKQRIQVTIPSAPDSQVTNAEVFRFGGSLPIWLYEGTCSPSSVFNDDFTDDVIASNEQLRFDLFQPFPVLDKPASGTANVSGTRVTATSGSFNTKWSANSEIIINNNTYHLYAPPSSTSALDVVENIGNLTSVSWQVPEATLFGTPLTSVSGPYGLGEFGSVMMAVGTGLQAGTLFWTNPDDPDSASDINNLDLTSPSEPLVATVLWDGRIIVFSTKRAFLTRPTTAADGTLTFLADEIPNAKGLWCRTAFCSTPNGIIFLGPDGLYITTGSEPEMLSLDLYQIFPHDGQLGSIVPDGSILPIDFTQTNDLRLSYLDGRVYFEFKDTSANKQTLILNPTLGGWESQDIYSPPINFVYSEEGQSNHAALLLGTDGRVYQFGGSSETFSCSVVSGAMDQGDSRLKKLYGDLMVDYDSGGIILTPSALIDATIAGSTPTTLTPSTLNNNGRTQSILDLLSGKGLEGKNIQFSLSWTIANTAAIVRLFEWQPSFVPKSTITNLRATDLSDLGYPGPKFIQGVRLRANTSGVNRTIDIYADNGPNGLVQIQSGQSLTANHNGESRIAYSFPAPFIAHLVKMLPNDLVNWELYEEPEWIFNPAPELGANWITQETTFDLPNFNHVRDLEIPHISTSNITLTITIDGVAYPYIITASGGSYLKSYVVPLAVKGKAHKFSLVSSQPFRLFVKDTYVRVKAWRGQGSYMGVLPFGDQSRIPGGEARV